jgi:hypothetical protein
MKSVTCSFACRQPKGIESIVYVELSCDYDSQCTMYDAFKNSREYKFVANISIDAAGRINHGNAMYNGKFYSNDRISNAVCMAFGDINVLKMVSIRAFELLDHARSSLTLSNPDASSIYPQPQGEELCESEQQETT